MIVDAHVHIGQPGSIFTPQSSAEDLLQIMNRLQISHAICTDHRSIYEGGAERLSLLQQVFEQSGGRIGYLAVYHPHNGDACLTAMRQAVGLPGLLGIKIHPSIHKVPAESPLYEPLWRFADSHQLTILTHSWSTSDYNPVQQYSLPARFERYVQAFPAVRLVLGHAGGRGLERADAMRMARDYPEVYLDFAGDVFCYRLIETLVQSVPVEKILFGSDYPWLDPRANLSRVLLSQIDNTARRMILGENARIVYRMEGLEC